MEFQTLLIELKRKFKKKSKHWVLLGPQLQSKDIGGLYDEVDRYAQRVMQELILSGSHEKYGSMHKVSVGYVLQNETYFLEVRYRK